MRTGNDLSLYGRNANHWWDPKHKAFRSLHSVHLYRLKQVNCWIPSFAGLKVLDVGCGGGIFADSLVRAGAQVTGIDICSRSLEVARSHVPGAVFHEADVVSLPFETDSFDIVMMADVIEHIEEKHAALAECSRVLKSGGRLYVHTLNRTLKARCLGIHLVETLGLVPSGTHSFDLLTHLPTLIENCRERGLKLCYLDGAAPRYLKTLGTWSVHLKSSTDTSVAYSAMFSLAN